MNISEMHIAFKFRLDKLDSLNYPEFEPEEIDLLLNQAQDRFVKQRYGINNIKRQSFEESQKRTDDLRNIVKRITLTPNASTSDNKPNGVFVTLPSTVGQEMWFAVNEEANITFTDCNDSETQRRVSVRPIQHDDYNKIIYDPFDKPYEYEILRLASDTYYELISADNTTINSYYLTYIKKPVRVDYTNNIDCELSDHTHDEIVDEAVRIALEAIEAKRQQSFNNIENTNE